MVTMREAEAGERIDVYFEEAIVVAAITGQDVEAEFNGTPVRVTPTDTQETVYQQWWRTRQAQQQEMK